MAVGGKNVRGLWTSLSTRDCSPVINVNAIRLPDVSFQQVVRRLLLAVATVISPVALVPVIDSSFADGSSELQRT